MKLRPARLSELFERIDGLTFYLDFNLSFPCAGRKKDDGHRGAEDAEGKGRQGHGTWKVFECVPFDQVKACFGN